MLWHETKRRIKLALTGLACLWSCWLPQAAQAREKIVFLTGWTAQADYGGFYQAVAEGLYDKHGITVELREGGPGINASQLLAAKAVDFALVQSNDAVVNLRRAGAPVTAVAAFAQKNQQTLITHKGNGIASLADMKGKPIMISTGSATTFWPWLRAKYGFTDTQIRKFAFSLAPFLSDPNAIQQGFITSTEYLASQQKAETTSFLLADYGYASYGVLLVVPEDWVKNKPAAVQAFVDATAEGWSHFLYGNPEPAMALIKQRDPQMSDGLLKFARERLVSLQVVDDANTARLGIGAMSDQRWREHMDVLVQEGVFPAGTDTRGAYTLQFVNRGPTPK
ncbi:ABC transporter substrate-binding protein [Xylophilus rhododendri]|uniref:ABC transporter substrate-binding protein n=1 Tax=Xylophilus rhododendri TaxID=2697032 RepID=A0A857J9Y2_9BURK|nr:ABC transporter substrate-binding protein [Xylophilus rhododendri]QHI99849.1 ABC transporter substrate-binding protein [Xylophilus rhododendri]